MASKVYCEVKTIKFMRDCTSKHRKQVASIDLLFVIQAVIKRTNFTWYWIFHFINFTTAAARTTLNAYLNDSDTVTFII